MANKCKDVLSTVLSHLNSVINDDISNADYADSILVAYVNDSLVTLCEYIRNVLDR